MDRFTEFTEVVVRKVMSLGLASPVHNCVIHRLWRGTVCRKFTAVGTNKARAGCTSIDTDV